MTAVTDPVSDLARTHDWSDASDERGGLATLWSDAVVYAGRNIAHIRQIPEKLLDVTVQPLMFVLLFAYVFGGAIGVSGGNYREYVIAGILMQSLAFGLTGPATAIATDLTEGVIDRFRSLPATRAAYLLGHYLAELAGMALSIVVLLSAGLVVGWRTHTGVGHVTGALLLLLLFASAMIWIGTWIGLSVRSADAVMGVGLRAGVPPHVPVQRVRAHRHPAPRAAAHRRLEPHLGDGGRRAGDVRQPGGPGRRALVAARPPGAGRLHVLHRAAGGGGAGVAAALPQPHQRLNLTNKLAAAPCSSIQPFVGPSGATLGVMTDEAGSGPPPEAGPPIYPAWGDPAAAGPDPSVWLKPVEGDPGGRGQASVDAPPKRPPSRGWNAAVAVMSVAVLGVAVALFLGARQASSDTSAARAQAAAMEQSRLDLDVKQNGLDDQRRAIDSALSDVDTAMASMDTALTTAADAQHHLVDVDDRAVAMFNQGNRSGATALVKGDGAAALADLDQKTTAAVKAVADAQTAVQQLQAKIDG